MSGEGWIASHPISDDMLVSENPFVESEITIETIRTSEEQPIESQVPDFGIEGLIPDDTIQGKIAREVYGRGKERAQGFVSLYANIDLVRPYFDVEPAEVASRVAFSIFPFRKGSEVLFPDENLDEEVKKPDLYGPLMLCFTLSSILLFGLKLQQDIAASSSRMEEGTLLSTALFVCFAFWLVSTVVYYFLSFMFNTNISFLQVASLSGYAQFGVCVSLLVHCFFTGWIDTIAMICFGGLSALTLGVEFFLVTPQKKHGILVAVVAIAVQLCFLIYLKIFYAAISQTELSSLWHI